MCWYFLKISSTFEQYRDNTDNRDNFGHYNRDKKFSYRYIPMQRAGPHCTAAHRETSCAPDGQSATASNCQHAVNISML